MLIYLKKINHKIIINKVVIGGATCNLLMNLTFVIATKLTSAANAIVLQFTAPIFLIIYIWIIWRKKPDRKAVAACISVFAGILCFFFDKLSFNGQLGNFLAIISGALYAVIFLLKKIKDIHSKSRGVYGAPRVHKQLTDIEKIPCSLNTVARIMQQNGIQARSRRKFKATTNSKHNYPVSNNVLNRNFTVEEPNKVWVADITYIPTDEGWLYLAAVMDLSSRKIVGWAMDSTMTRKLVINALQQAIGRRRPGKGVLHHSDRGSQYASSDYQDLLKEHKFVGSMSRKGNCYDNACMESFFHSLKVELVYLTKFHTRVEAKQSIFEYIELFYNKMRLHSSLGYMSPLDYERQFLRNAA
jgi:transposase InsO family protein